MNKHFISIIALTACALAAFFFFPAPASLPKKSPIPLVCIANYGPHASLEASIKGLKTQLLDEGFTENKTVRYKEMDVGFDPALIPQMVAKLKNDGPAVIVATTTPVAQFTKGHVCALPVVYNVITDPVEAGLLTQQDQPNGNITGSSDRQDLSLMLKFATTLLPHAKTIGVLYATAESNDLALVQMMRDAAQKMNMTVLAIPVDQARDVPLRMQAFKGKVDIVYVGTSGPIQPTLPVIAAECKKMNIPVFNADAAAVKEGLALASYGVDYETAGRNTGKLVAAILRGAPINSLKPLYPTQKEHHGFVNKRKALELGIPLPASLPDVTVVE